MLDKVKIIMILGLVIQVLRAFFPGLDLGEEFEGAAKAIVESLYVLVPIIVGWFAPESEVLVNGLKLRR